MANNDIRGAIESDFGVTRKSSQTSSNAQSRHDLVRVTADIQRRTDELLDQSAPATLGEKIIDAFFPSPTRAAKQRGNRELVEAAIHANVAIYSAVRGAQVDQIEALAETYAKSAELQTTEEIAMRGIETATVVDQKIEDSGGEFDKKIDIAVKQANVLETATAKQSAADRIERRIAMRARVEDAAMQNVGDAVLNIRNRP